MLNRAVDIIADFFLIHCLVVLFDPAIGLPNLSSRVATSIVFRFPLE